MQNNEKNTTTNTNTTATQKVQKDFSEVAQKLKVGETKTVYPKRVIFNGQVMTREEALEWDAE